MAPESNDAGRWECEATSTLPASLSGTLCLECEATVGNDSSLGHPLAVPHQRFISCPSYLARSP